MRKLAVPLLVLAILASGCTITTSRSAPATRDVTVPATSDRSVVDVVQRVLPSVVNVTTDQFRQGGGQAQGVGTGFIVRSDGIVVTNCHVIENASKITVFTSDASPRQLQARLIGADCEHDIAVLKVDAANLPTVQLGDSTHLQLGQSVVAIGYALALDGGPTVTSGIVSSLSRTIQAADPGCGNACPSGGRTYSNVIQTDAAINPGNSGGPLVNLRGQVVGINTAGTTSAENIGFAIPVNAIKATLAAAELHPLAPTAYLGVVTEPVTPALAAQFALNVNSGLYVVDLSSGAPAEKAGLRQGDVILSIDGITVTTPDQLGTALAKMKPGQTVAVRYVRSSGTSLIDVTLGTRPLPATIP